MKYVILIWLCGFIYSYGVFLDSYTFLKKIANDTVYNAPDKKEIKNLVASKYVILQGLIILFFIWPHFLFFDKIFRREKK